MRQEVNKLQNENTQLHVSIDELETKVDQYVMMLSLMKVKLASTANVDPVLFHRLQGTETKLKAITDEQEANVDSFVALVKDNQVIIDEMKVRSCVSLVP